MFAKSSVDWKVLHKNVYGAVPPLTVKSVEPLLAPLQVTLMPVNVLVMAVGSSIV